jgi:hypothetical protein
MTRDQVRTFTAELADGSSLALALPPGATAGVAKARVRELAGHAVCSQRLYVPTAEDELMNNSVLDEVCRDDPTLVLVLAPVLALKYQTFQLPKMYQQQRFGMTIDRRGVVYSDQGSTVRKKTAMPDSTNVFVAGRVKTGTVCVEFAIHSAGDEMHIGVTPNPESVQMLTGWANARATDTWVYCKAGQSSPAFMLGPDRIANSANSQTLFLAGPQREVAGFDEGDRVAIQVG